MIPLYFKVITENKIIKIAFYNRSDFKRSKGRRRLK